MSKNDATVKIYRLRWYHTETGSSMQYFLTADEAVKCATAKRAQGAAMRGGYEILHVIVPRLVTRKELIEALNHANTTAAA